MPYIPRASDFRFDKYDKRVVSFSPEVEARAVIEHQALCKKAHLKSRFPELWIDGKVDRIILTGGASQNVSIAQIIADVFDTNVFVTENGNSAAYGSALKAKYVCQKMGVVDQVGFEHGITWTKLLVQPVKSHVKTYEKLLSRYIGLERSAVLKDLAD